jgi:hypothetical protein
MVVRLLSERVPTEFRLLSWLVPVDVRLLSDRLPAACPPLSERPLDCPERPPRSWLPWLPLWLAAPPWLAPVPEPDMPEFCACASWAANPSAAAVASVNASVLIVPPKMSAVPPENQSGGAGNGFLPGAIFSKMNRCLSAWQRKSFSPVGPGANATNSETVCPWCTSGAAVVFGMVSLGQVGAED